MFILAIDLGKYNSVFCGFDTISRELEYRTVKTSPEILQCELDKQPNSHVVIEACSPAGWVHDLCVSMAEVQCRQHQRWGLVVEKCQA